MKRHDSINQSIDQSIDPNIEYFFTRFSEGKRLSGVICNTVYADK